MPSPVRLTVLSLALSMTPSFAAEVETVVLQDMPLADTPIDGVASSFVTGSFGAAGTFAANATMRDGSLFPPHRHPDARLSVVVSGTMYLGVGETVDPAAEQALTAGALAVTPAGVPHWMAARDGDVTILEIGTGPTRTEWVD